METLPAATLSRPRVVRMICNCLVSYLAFDVKFLGIILSAFTNRNVLGLEINEIHMKPLYNNYWPD